MTLARRSNLTYSSSLSLHGWPAILRYSLVKSQRCFLVRNNILRVRQHRICVNCNSHSYCLTSAFLSLLFGAVCFLIYIIRRGVGELPGDIPRWFLPGDFPAVIPYGDLLRRFPGDSPGNSPGDLPWPWKPPSTDEEIGFHQTSAL